MKIYKAPVVRSIQEFYGNTLVPNTDLSISNFLNEIAIKMLSGLESKVECIYTQINNYHDDFLGVPIEILKLKQFQLADCHHTIANEYGFDSWNDVESQDLLRYNQNFEKCVQAVVNGNVDEILDFLKKDTSLIRKQSNYGHKATLLHYTASNGVELWRQQVPENLDKVIELLIENGADKGAKMIVYGGQFTVYELFTSSAHPYASGVDSSIAELLK